MLCFRFDEVCREDPPFDAVVDSVGGDYEKRSRRLLKKSGHFSEILNSGEACCRFRCMSAAITHGGSRACRALQHSCPGVPLCVIPSYI